MARSLTADQRGQLRGIPAPPPDLDVEAFPDFLIVGPQRTGTTWLFRNLNKHPQIYMPGGKEIYYFSFVGDSLKKLPDMDTMSKELAWYLQFFEETAAGRDMRQQQCQADFGEDYAPAVRGEASATYAAGISDEVLADLSVLNPALKVILIVRHPYERAWSHVKKDLNLDGDVGLDELDEDLCRRQLGGAYADACSRFSTIIDRWTAALAPDHLFVGNFEDIQACPGDLLVRIFRFLGIRDDEKYVGDHAMRKICATDPRPIPDHVLPLLRDLYQGELEELCRRGFPFDRH